MRFRCSKHTPYGCRFSCKAQMILTDDPKKAEFWTLENWQIIPDPDAKEHSCTNLKE